MAKRKTTAGDVGCLAVVILIAALAVLGPFAIAVWCVFCELRARRYRHVRVIGDVLTADEQAAFAQAERQVDQYDQQIAKALRRGDQAGYTRRADGLFDGRRVDARNLNQMIETLQHQRDNARAHLDHLQSTLGRKLGQWLTAVSSLAGARAAVITFIVSFILVMALAGESLAPADLLFGDPNGEPGARLGVSFLSVGLAGLAMFVVGSRRRAALAA